MPHQILIVDDEPNIVVPLQFLMEQNGYSVIVAQSGEEALEAVSKYKPELVLLDIMLPGIDGFEVCEIESRNDSPATREVYAALADRASRWRLASHAACRGDVVFLPLGTHLRRVLRAAAIVLGCMAAPFRDTLSDDILEIHARRSPG